MENFEMLAKRIRVLEDMEAIKALKAAYFNSIDGKDWEGLAACFAENSVWESARRNVKVEGKNEIVAFIRNIEDGDHIINTHNGHNPQIKFIDEDHATCLWELAHYREDHQKNEKKMSAAFYADDYAKIDGKWFIMHTRVQPIYLAVY